MRTVLVGAAILGLAVTAASAQTGGIRVRVIDQSDKGPLPGVTVTLSNSMQLAATSTVVTDIDGNALFPVLRAGSGYSVEVFLQGYAKQRLSDLKVRVNETTDVPIAMTTEIQEKVIVTGKRDVVDLEKTTSSTKFSDEFIQDLPVAGRFYQNVLSLAPGVQDTDGDGNPVVHGSRERDFKTTVSGISNQDPLSGEWGSYVNPDSIEEMEVITAGAGAEFGRAQGGFANIIQKQGSNDFEGSFEFIYRSSNLDGNGATNLKGRQLPEFDWYQPSLLVSGPIVTDHLWYRLSYAYFDISEPLNLSRGVETRNTTRSVSAHQITWQVSPRNKLAFQYSADPEETTNVDVSSVVRPVSSYTQERGGPTYSMTWTAPYSPKLLVETQVAYSDLNYKYYPQSARFDSGCVSDPESLALAYCQDLQSGQVSGAYFQNWRDNRQRLTVRGQGTYYLGRMWGMNHQLKFGLTVENERYYRELQRYSNLAYQNIGIPQGDPSGGGGGDIRPRRYVLGSVYIPESTAAGNANNTWGVFFEDQLRLRQNLTMTVGLRLDQEQLGSSGWQPFNAEAEFNAFESLIAQGGGALSTEEANLGRLTTFTADSTMSDSQEEYSRLTGIPTTSYALITQQAQNWRQTRRPYNIVIDNTNISPRFSVSWDPWSDGKSRLAFTGGRYYDKIFLAIPLAEIDPPSYDFAFYQLEQGADNWIFDTTFGAVNPAASINVVSRDLKTPYKDEFSLSFEREIAQETSFRITLVRNRFRDQFQDTDINHVPQDMVVNCALDQGRTPFPGTVAGTRGQDGLLDDCGGRVIESDFSPDPSNPFITPKKSLFEYPDGIADLYQMNPAWSEIYLIGNFNYADYSGVVLELIRRQFRNWQMDASYTWSKAEGQAEDYNQLLGDDRSSLDDEQGYLSTDQRHVVKVNATTITPWGLRLGGAVRWESGLPYSILQRTIAFDQLPPPAGPDDTQLGAPSPRTRITYPTRQRNDQRSPSAWNFDVRAAKEMNLPKGMNLQLTMEVFNLFNSDSLRIFNNLNSYNISSRRFGRRFQVGARLGF